MMSQEEIFILILSFVIALCFYSFFATFFTLARSKKKFEAIYEYRCKKFNRSIEPRGNTFDLPTGENGWSVSFKKSKTYLTTFNDRPDDMYFLVFDSIESAVAYLVPGEIEPMPIDTVK